jgi:hypothetical protein
LIHLPSVLNGVARHQIKPNLIRENWDDALRLAGSLKLGFVQATSIMKTLRIDDRPTKLAQAVAELGRIDKTIHALTYIDDEAKRRRTLIQLNRGEERHKAGESGFPWQTRRTPATVQRGSRGPARRAGARGECDCALEHALHERCLGATSE